MIEFPKALYRNETDRVPTITVQNWDEQLEAEKDGWIDITPKETQNRPVVAKDDPVVAPPVVSDSDPEQDVPKRKPGRPKRK